MNSLPLSDFCIRDFLGEVRVLLQVIAIIAEQILKVSLLGGGLENDL